MIVIDLVIVALVLGLAVWGFFRGVTVGTMAWLGFGVGAVVGSRLAPLPLDEGAHSSFAPVVALPGALLVGGLCAAAVERLAFRRRVRFERLGRANAVVGALACACLGVLATWIGGSIAAQVKSLREPIQRSAILKGLTTALPPPGPVLLAEPPKLAPFPTFEGPAPEIPPPDPAVLDRRAIKLAAGSVVKVEVEGCGGGGSGSGWFGARGVVVTNAHVVAGSDSIRVKLQGKKSTHKATSVWFDEENDLALLRVSGLGKVAPLPLERSPTFGTSGAMLGYPAGFWDVRAARLGKTGSLRKLLMADRPRQRVYAPKRSVTAFAGKAQPGYSGAPIVDTGGRVVTTIFAGFRVGGAGFGVPNRFVRTALARAGPPVSHGQCEEE